jgi:hypothetical protein
MSEEPIPIHSYTSLPSVIYPDQSLPVETNTFLKEDTFFSLGFASFWWRTLKHQPSNFNPKCKAQCYLIKKLGLDREAKLTPCKMKLYDRIRTGESALCKLRKKYMTKNLIEVCHVDSNPLIRSLMSSLNVQTVGFLATVVRNSRH